MIQNDQFILSERIKQKQNHQSPIFEIPTTKNSKAVFSLEKNISKPIHSEKSNLDVHTFSYVENAKILIKNNEYDLALKLLIQSVLKHPTNSYILRWLGLCFEKKRNYQSALKCYFQWYKEEQNEHSLSSLAGIFYQIGQDELALKYYQSALSFIKNPSPVLFDIYKNIGNIYVKSGDFEYAEEHYNKAYTLNPNSDTLLVNFGTLEIQKNNIELALQRFKEALEINPKNDKAWVGLALINRSMNDFDLAWGNLTTALDQNLENQTALEIGVNWSIQDQKYEIIIEKLQEYSSLYPLNLQFSYLLAQLLYLNKNTKLSLIELNRTSSIDPENESSFYLYNKISGELKHA